MSRVRTIRRLTSHEVKRGWSARQQLDAHRKVLVLSRGTGSWCAFIAPLLSPSSRWYDPLDNNDKPAQEDEESRKPNQIGARLPLGPKNGANWHAFHTSQGNQHPKPAMPEDRMKQTWKSALGVKPGSEPRK
jgi:hypothetical protein